MPPSVRELLRSTQLENHGYVPVVFLGHSGCKMSDLKLPIFQGHMTSNAKKHCPQHILKFVEASLDHLKDRSLDQVLRCVTKPLFFKVTKMQKKLAHNIT